MFGQRSGALEVVPRTKILEFVVDMGMGQNPGTPSEPQNSWVKMDVHPTKNGINRY